MNSAYDAYGAFIIGPDTDLEKSGRYAFMAGCESVIAQEIRMKLDLSEQDSFLEVGFGSGLLLEPLSNYVGLAHGVDHPNCAEVFLKKYPASKVVLHGCNFLSMPTLPFGRFSKVLIYSVVHCLETREEVVSFVKKALSMLKPGGLMLIGDIPNSSAKSRFLSTKEGREVEGRWSKLVRENGGSQPDSGKEPRGALSFDDEFLFDILLMMRSEGHEAYLLPQGIELPFSQTREDILVRVR